MNKLCVCFTHFNKTYKISALNHVNITPSIIYILIILIPILFNHLNAKLCLNTSCFTHHHFKQNSHPSNIFLLSFLFHRIIIIPRHKHSTFSLEMCTFYSLSYVFRNSSDVAARPIQEYSFSVTEDNTDNLYTISQSCREEEEEEERQM